MDLSIRHFLSGDQAEMFTEVKKETKMSTSRLAGTVAMSLSVQANCCLEDIDLGVHTVQFKKQKANLSLSSLLCM